ncbi:MAG: helix-turn-helix transcriptional regulator [Armatimonadetes bacterium]|nr:helix-turn-helix transcriptional regulator [Armatimonadota bacterium]
MDSKSHEALRSAEFGRAIQRRRKALRLTQPEASRLSGSSVDFIVDLEAGKETVRFDKVLDVIAVLGLGLHLDESTNALTVGKDL